MPRETLEAARELPRKTERRAEHPGRGGAPDPCAGLDEAERALFNHLREWRASVAHQEGVPPYVICTNRQLVAVVRRRPDSPTALGHIEGLGPGKVERYTTWNPRAAFRGRARAMPSCGSG